jgi:hypothetical protein
MGSDSPILLKLQIQNLGNLLIALILGILLYDCPLTSDTPTGVTSGNHFFLDQNQCLLHVYIYSNSLVYKHIKV